MAMTSIHAGRAVVLSDLRDAGALFLAVFRRERAARNDEAGKREHAGDSGFENRIVFHCILLGGCLMRRCTSLAGTYKATAMPTAPLLGVGASKCRKNEAFAL